MAGTNGNGNGNGAAWDAWFWRFARYAGAGIAALMFLEQRLPTRNDVAKVQAAVDSLRYEVRVLAARTVTKEVSDRRWRELNEELSNMARVHNGRYRPIE